jgi:hypothetical protein
MAATISSLSTTKTVQRLAGTTGANAMLAALTANNPAAGTAATICQVTAQNVAADLAERSTTVRYPALNVYCERIVNDLTEKFQTFSGRVVMAIEVRHSQDGIEGLESAVEGYVDAVMQALDANRGDWSDGMYYAGGYQASFGPVKHGGKNFIQIAKVNFEIGVGVN